MHREVVAFLKRVTEKAGDGWGTASADVAAIKGPLSVRLLMSELAALDAGNEPQMFTATFQLPSGAEAVAVFPNLRHALRTMLRNPANAGLFVPTQAAPLGLDGKAQVAGPPCTMRVQRAMDAALEKAWDEDANAEREKLEAWLAENHPGAVVVSCGVSPSQALSLLRLCWTWWESFHRTGFNKKVFVCNNGGGGRGRWCTGAGAGHRPRACVHRD